MSRDHLPDFGPDGPGTPGDLYSDAPPSGDRLPEATVSRLPVYLRVLTGMAERGVVTVSSDQLATGAGVNSAKLRKDLSHLGSYGIRGVGAGNLGRALANYGGFATRGFRIAALLDSDPVLVGTQVGRLAVRDSDDLEDVVAQHKVAIGAIATPAGSAQGVCDRLVAAGVTSILNFAPLVLNVADGVDVRKVDLSIELQILAFHAQRRSVERNGRAPQGALRTVPKEAGRFPAAAAQSAVEA